MPRREDDRWCRRCGCEGLVRDSVVRDLAHEPFGWRPTTLRVTVRRYRCTGCDHVWRQDTSLAAAPRAKLSRRALAWALEALVCQHLTVARVAEAIAVAWDTANDDVLAEGHRVLLADPARFDGSRLLDMVEGRSKAAFMTWLAARPPAWRDTVEVVAMDGRRVQDRHDRGTPARHDGHGPVPRRPARRRRSRSVSAPGPAGPDRPPRPCGRPAVPVPPHPAHRARPSHRPPTRPPGRTVRHRGSRRSRSHLGPSISAASPPTATPTRPEDKRP